MKKNYLLLLSAMLGVIVSANGQVAINSSWTWMQGNTTIHVPGVYGTKGVPAAANNPGRRQDGLSFKDNSGNFWLFGGFGNDYYNDLWKYNPVTNQWTWVSGDNMPNEYGVYGTKGVSASTNKPGARSNAVGWMDVSGNIWVFGGVVWNRHGVNGYQALNDLWKYNVTSDQWTWMNGDSIEQVSDYGTLGVESSTNSPAGRGGAAGWTDNSGNLWLFGGDANYILGISAYPFNDRWKYNPSTNNWTWMGGGVLGGNIHTAQGEFAPGNTPGARSSSTIFKDVAGKIWLFGGVEIVGTWGDLWKFNPTSNQWAWMKGDAEDNHYNVAGNNGTLGVADPLNNPQSRYKAGGWTDPYGNLLLFGGTSEGQCACTMYDDVWRYNIINNQWTLVKADNSGNQTGIYGTMGMASATNKPGSRFGQFSWSDASSNLWLYGGNGFDTNGDRGYLSDLWNIGSCTDAHPPKIKFENISVVEGDGGTLNAVFTLELSKLGSCQLVSVDFTTQDGTATAGQDYVAVSGTATFTANSTTTTVIVPIIGDLMDEKDNEYFTLELSNPFFATIGTASKKCVIEDNDPEPTVSINDVTVYEDAGQAVLTISLSAASGKEVKVKYKTANGSAVQPQDYTKTNDEVIIDAGSTFATAIVPIINDNINESSENFTVQLSNAKNAGIGDGVGLVTILNGNAPGGGRIITSSSVLKGQKPANPKAGQFNVRVLNNPSPSYFELHTESNSSGTINVRIIDVNGKLIEIIKNVSVGQSIKFGNNYKQGIYFVEVMQGKNRKILKLVKL